jgi:hypothetical protein
MRKIRAYFIGGPKHGDIDFIDDHTVYLLPLDLPNSPRSYGHYWAYDTPRHGRYNRDRLLVGGEFGEPVHGRPQSWIYIYQGEER